MRAHTGRRAVRPDLLFPQSRSSQPIDIEVNPKCLRDMAVLNGQLPGQEHLGAIPLSGEVGRVEAAAVARNDSVGLAGIEDHHRAPDQGDAMTCDGKVHVQPPVLAQKEIAESRATILRAVVVVPRAAAGHQGDFTGRQHVVQTQRSGPVGNSLHAMLVVRPPGTRTRQGQDLDVSRFQTQALRYVPLPIGDQPCRRRGDADHTG